MIIITETQYQLFKDVKIAQLVLSIAEKIKTQFYSKSSGIEHIELIDNIRQHVSWCINNKIVKISNIEYFTTLCFSYKFDIITINDDNNIKGFIEYPDRTEEDKLFLFHYYLKYESE